MKIHSIRKFLKLEAAGGIILFIMAILAILLDNSPISSYFEAFLDMPISLHIGSWEFSESLRILVNEGLMPIFFLSVGLELKREFQSGELSTINKIILPGAAALGGMVVPALIFLLINIYHPLTMKGWVIPVATDIAFALGVLSLFGKRVPIGLKIFLLALAIFDDVGAILIIALLLTKTLSWLSLFAAVLILLLLWRLNRSGVLSLVPYFLLGFLLWAAVLKSGIHATVAGVILALFIPSDSVQVLIEKLHKWVAYLVLPLFALANAGFSFAGMHAGTFTDVLTLGIVLGLFVGKQLGVFSFAWIMVKLGWAKLPDKTTWLGIYGVSILCGIGFTMSLFLGTLAFEMDGAEYLTEIRLGVLLASLISSIVGAMVLQKTLSANTKNA